MPSDMESPNAISFSVLGGGGEIGANCFQVAYDGRSILLDCGFHPKREGRAVLPELSLLRHAPDALIVSHGHLDHCGAIPYLLRQFPELPAYSTRPTARVIDRMLHNSVSVMELMACERNVRDYPLYVHDDVDYALRSIRTYDFEDPFVLDGKLPAEVSFHDAGHVLGSASVLLKTPGHSLFYTGDVCETDQELMAGRTRLGDDVRVDTLIIESTRGAMEEQDGQSHAEEAVRLGDAIRRVLRGGGVALLPCFALGRTQEILNILARLQEEGRIPPVPIYTSGLGRALYEVYDRFGGYLKHDGILRPLEQFGHIGNVWEPDVVDDLLRHPCIMVATSGMMIENTPSALIAQSMVRYNHHGIFFVGYVDQGTLGHQLLHATPGDRLRFQIGMPPVEVKLENIKRFFFSAHATRSALSGIIRRLRPKNVVYIHGEQDAIDWMVDNTGNGYRCYAPTVGQSVRLEA